MLELTTVEDFKSYSQEWSPITGLGISTLSCRWAVTTPCEASYTHIFHDHDTTFRVIIHVMGPRVNSPDTQCPFGITLCQISFWHEGKHEWYEILELPYRKFEDNDRHSSHHSGRHGEEADWLELYTLFDKDEICLILTARKIMGVSK